jgi:hypothetical protein
MDEKESSDYLLTVRKMRDYAQEEFDKLIVYLSSGGLVLTVGFVKDLVFLSEAGWKTLLILSWSGFIISLILILLSHRSAIKSSTLELDGKENESDEQDQKTERLNLISFVALIIAVIVFVLFISINLL